MQKRRKVTATYLDRTKDGAFLVFDIEGGEQLQLQVVTTSDVARNACLQYLQLKYLDDWEAFASDLESLGGEGVWAHYCNGPDPDPNKLNSEYRRWTDANNR